MKRAGRVCTMGLAALLSAATAMAQNSITNIFTNQGGGFKPCDTKYLPTGIFSRVIYDNAGQPCVFRGSQTGKCGETCDSNTAWNYSVHGHLTLKTAPGYESGRVEVRMYIGGGGGECMGGQTTSCPDFEIPGHHYLVEDSLITSAEPILTCRCHSMRWKFSCRLSRRTLAMGITKAFGYLRSR